MITVRKIDSKKDYKKFVRFPIELYKNCENYIPSMESDEIKMTTKRNPHYGECDQAYFLAEQDGKVVGRIACLIMHRYNEKNNSKYARFTRFDIIDDEVVAHSLLSAAVNWAKEMGMEYVHGPLGYDDMEKEGLLVSGFEHKGSFITSYNFDYYQKHIESFGFKPDARWVEWKFNLPQSKNERVDRIANIVEKRYGFHETYYNTINKMIKHHRKEFFDLLDETFEELYGTFSFNDELRRQLISMFKLVLNEKYLCLVFDKQNKLIGFGLTWPSLADAMKITKGRAFPFGWIQWLKAIRKPNAVELGIIAVKKEYQKLGVTAFIINKLLNRINNVKTIKYAVTGVQLETNTNAIGALDMFDRELIRKKTCYLIKI